MTRFEIWDLPAAATPQLPGARRLGGLGGRNFDLVTHRVLRRLAEAGVGLDRDSPGRSLPTARRFRLPEGAALHLGLLFRALAPMRSRPAMRAVAEGIEEMDSEEAAYWLGMAMHRKRPRRVLMALRRLLTEPPRAQPEFPSAGATITGLSSSLRPTDS